MPLRAAPEDAMHPLDALTSREITVAADTLRAYEAFPKDGLFSTIVCTEPPKQEVLDFKPRRRVSARGICGRDGPGEQPRVRGGRRPQGRPARVLEGGPRRPQPLVFVVENDVLIPQIVKADPAWQAAMRRRGITDFDKVGLDTWAVGQVSGRHEGRLLRAFPRQGRVATTSTGARSRAWSRWST